jgi:HSP20 family molecular chaperone IbpA
MRELSEQVDRLLADFPFVEGRSDSTGQWSPRIEIFQRSNEFVIRADLPGLTKSDVTVDVTEDTMTIHGERRQEPEERGLLLSEPGFGTFRRTVPLPKGVKSDSVKATFKNGVLEIVMITTEVHRAAAEHLTPTTHKLFSELPREKARAIFLTRALRGIERIAKHASADAISEAAAAPTDVSVVMHALEQPEIIAELKADDPLAPARIRGLQERQRLLSVGDGTWDAEAVAKHLRLSRQAVNRRRQQGTLLGIHAGRHGYLYPAWQFTREGTIKGLETVLSFLHHHDAWMQQIFMVNANDRLGGDTPLKALRAGHLEDVKRAARAYGEHGAA